MFLELQIPDGENSNYVELQPWEVDYIARDEDKRIHLRTIDNCDYYPIQINFIQTNES